MWKSENKNKGTKIKLAENMHGNKQLMKVKRVCVREKRAEVGVNESEW